MNLDNINEIRRLDSQNMLGSLQFLGKQIEQVLEQSKSIKVPSVYKKVSNIVVLGMGGSALGAHVIKTVFQGELAVPLEIVNGYHVPGFVNKNSLVVVSSYSGTTEEPLAAMQEAQKRKAKLLIITSGGMLRTVAKKNKIPALIFTTEKNPCGSPRMGLGYSIVGQFILLSKAGLLEMGRKQYSEITAAIERAEQRFGAAAVTQHNRAKQLAEKTADRSVWYVAAEHLGGNAHVAANQMNENAKRFAGHFLVPELNHHLMEGMLQPPSNKEHSVFILIESSLYDKRVQKRFDITRKVLDKNGILYVRYVCQEKTKLAQAAEVLVLGSYVSYYSAILQGIDPTAIPFVDFFKSQLATN